MPFIKISSLRKVPKTGKVMRSIEKALYKKKFKGKNLIPENMATCMWQTTDCMVHQLEPHYEFNKKQVEIPIFVDLYVNTWFTKKQVGKIMDIIATQLSKRTKLNKKYVFIQVHIGKPGYVFINGKVFSG